MNEAVEQDLMADETVENERVIVCVKMDRALWFDYDEILRQGLFRIRETLTGLEKMVKELPMYPKAGEPYVEPRVSGVPVSRDALEQMVQHYRKIERSAVQLLKDYDAGKTPTKF